MQFPFSGANLSEDGESIEGVYAMPQLKIKSLTLAKHKRDVGYLHKKAIPTSDVF